MVLRILVLLVASPLPTFAAALSVARHLYQPIDESPARHERIRFDYPSKCSYSRFGHQLECSQDQIQTIEERIVEVEAALRQGTELPSTIHVGATVKYSQVDQGDKYHIVWLLSTGFEGNKYFLCNDAGCKDIDFVQWGDGEAA
ncbi:hypothetical protein PIIN_11065 [Serendipita indica DSM 11827]|uniref:Uncharacterized protein n=1 Tax=Serendipita indica (strain DSM 11827) TaxID=1109443 RepID=G4U0I7_SERID|nr:hypothetical protein PIIN_11065 [Serendipita indica DSM 11827]